MIIVGDFETETDREHSPKKLTQEAYIRSSRFGTLCLVIWNYETGELLAELRGPKEVAKWIAAWDWSTTTFISHHAHFECGILSFVYRVVPRFIIDTLSMARAIYGPAVSVSLEACAARLALPPKTLDYNLFVGLRWDDLTDELKDELVAGCRRDVELTYQLAKSFLPRFPKQELVIIDMTVRMFTQPMFVGDADRLEELAEEEFYRKNDQLDELGVTQKQLQSSAQFVELLTECGEAVPRKQGKAGQQIPCIARTDEYMRSLIGRDDRVGALARARLDVRSTLEETRAWQLASAARRGPLPIYLSYCGAATTRWSGGDDLNPQNLPKTGGLRQCFKAPEGYKLVIADFSQIEYRILMALAGQKDKLEDLARGEDIYAKFAMRLFGLGEISKVSSDEREFGKKIILGCGYGMGRTKFAQLTQALNNTADDDLIKEAIVYYRNTEYPCVSAFWRQCDAYLGDLASGNRQAILGDRLVIDGGHVELPNGLRCPFTLRWDDPSRSYIRTTRAGESTYWGGAFTEFLCQALARVCLSDVMLKMASELPGARPVLLVHDELIYMLRDELAKPMLDWLVQWMSRTPAWWPNGPPMRAVGRIADAYGEEKKVE